MYTPYLFKNESSDALQNAQRNLMGRTHYVDPDTLRFHKSKVLAAHVIDRGLLFAIITSDALDYDNTRRGFRYAIFDVFGHVVARTAIEDAYRTREQASKAMWAVLNTFDAVGHTLDAADVAKKHFLSDIETLRKQAIATPLIGVAS